MKKESFLSNSQNNLALWTSFKCLKSLFLAFCILLFSFYFF